MMHFSEHLMDAPVEIQTDGIPSRGRIVSLFEGRNWTPMSVVRFTEGPEKGRAIPIPLESLTYLEGV